MPKLAASMESVELAILTLLEFVHHMFLPLLEPLSAITRTKAVDMALSGSAHHHSDHEGRDPRLPISLHTLGNDDRLPLRLLHGHIHRRHSAGPLDLSNHIHPGHTGANPGLPNHICLGRRRDGSVHRSGIALWGIITEVCT